MSRLFKRADSPYWWYTHGTPPNRIVKSTKSRRLRTAELIRNKWDEEFVLVQNRLKAQPIQFQDFYEEYLSHLQKTKNPAYAHRIHSSIRSFYHFLRQVDMHTQPINSFDTKDGNQFVYHRIQQERAPKTINLDVAALKEMWEYCMNMNYSLTNPWDDVDTPAPVIVSPRTDLDIDMVNDVIDNAEREQDKLLWSILTYTGMRVRDAASLVPEDIINDTIVLSPEKVRRYAIWIAVPLHRKLLEIPREKLYQIDPYNRDHQVSRNNFRNGMAQRGWKKRVDLHSLRHTFATRLFALKMSVEDIKLLTGWSTSQQAKKYIHSQEKRIRDAINRMK